MKHLSFNFFQKYIKLAIQEDPLLVLLIATLVEFQNLLIITYKIEAIDHATGDPYLVSLDVCSLHTNIPHKEGIEAVKQKLKTSKPSISIKVILNFLNLFLDLTIWYSMA